ELAALFDHVPDGKADGRMVFDQDNAYGLVRRLGCSLRTMSTVDRNRETLDNIHIE
ncbi:hypothetical protein INQ17_24470, partial [Escherichia coli]|nr:hypothetical protein [Escherichia coli]